MSTHDWSTYIEVIQNAGSKEVLDDIEQQLFGRKNGTMTTAMKQLKDMNPDEKKQFAKDLNIAKHKLTTTIEEKRESLSQPSSEELATKQKLDSSLELPAREHGHLHLIPEFIRSIEEVFGRMGFDVFNGPELEEEEYNFNLLNISDDHPARDGADTFWTKNHGRNEEKNYVLRTHTSPCQIRYMQENKPPFRAIFPGKVYRKDLDATHSPMFHQFEGLMIDTDISVAHLKAVLVKGLQELIGREVEFRFRTGYFPFVEPGLEMDMMWQGDMKDSREGKWLEMGGCGMVHPNVLENVGIDPSKYQGFAFGFGVERPLMIKHQIPDLRSFYQGDPRFLEQF